jgi:hypothetical protein
MQSQNNSISIGSINDCYGLQYFFPTLIPLSSESIGLSTI